MSSIAFIDQKTGVPSSWLNDLNTVAYIYFGDGTNLTGNLTLPAGKSLILSGGGGISGLASFSAATLTATVNVVTPLLSLGGVVSPKILFTPSSGSTRVGSFYQNGDTLFMAQDGVSNRFQMDLATGSITPSVDNVATLGTGSFRWSTGNFGTSVVTPTVISPSGNLNLQAAGGANASWAILNVGAQGDLIPNSNSNTQSLGAATSTIKTGYFGTSVVTPIINSAVTGVGALQSGGVTQFIWDNTPRFYPNVDNNSSLGIATNRWSSGYFGTSVVVPVITSPAATSLAFDVNAGSGTWLLDTTTRAFRPFVAQDNLQDIGASTARVKTGYFGTSVVTPLVSSTSSLALNAAAATNLLFQVNGVSLAVINASGSFPNTDNSIPSGLASNRWSALFAPIIDSGTTGSLSLRLNNGETILDLIRPGGAAVNRWTMQGGVSGSGGVALFPTGGDATISPTFYSRGATGISFATNVATPSNQFTILDTPSATRNITVTGSNGGNPTFSTTAGNLAITPTVVLGATLTFSTAASKIIPGVTSLSMRNNADNQDNLIILDNGNTTIRGTLTAIGGVTGATSAVDIQTFTAGGTWTKPANAKSVFVLVIGAGGGGAGGSNASSNAGAGGGGGATAQGMFNAADVGATETITVGTGGTGGTQGGTGGAGGVGGNSSFGARLIGYGGGGGIASGANPTGGSGGGTGGAGLAGANADVIGGAPSTVAGAHGTGGQGGGAKSGTPAIGSSAEFGGGAGGGAFNGGAGKGGTSIFGGGGGGSGGQGLIAGGAGGNTGTFVVAGGGGGAGGGAGANAGTAGAADVGLIMGQGGGGGGGNNAGAGGNGGVGGAGGGGGGGGGSGSSVSGGTGGAGGRGEVRVYTYF